VNLLQQLQNELLLLVGLGQSGDAGLFQDRVFGEVGHDCRNVGSGNCVFRRRQVLHLAVDDGAGCGEPVGDCTQSATDAGKFRGELKELPMDDWPNRLRRLVSEQVSLILRRSVDPNRSLAEYGLDSLGNLELRTRIETETGIRISSTNITTVQGLAGHLCNALADLDPLPA